MMVFSANPEDYTARGKIITPLKDRIGSEIRTHYPATRRRRPWPSPPQEAWLQRGDVFIPSSSRSDRGGGVPGRGPIRDRQAIGRQPAAADLAHRERASRTPSAAALLAGETTIVPRITDIYAALPAITGKFELEYEGELRGADNVARDIIRGAVGKRLRRLLRQRRPAAGDRMVRPRRQSPDRRHARR
jgi:magnesium chelatase subunit I